MKKFQEVYDSLNLEQRRAVDAIEGPVLVIAGPGTGKTQVLTTRIANILLKTDAPPRAILALTFTESGVKVMKERLISLIGPQAYDVNIYTFHSFCSDVIKDNPDRFILGENFEPLSELERVRIFREILDGSPPTGRFEILRPFASRYYYVRSLIKNIQDLKREGIAPEDLEISLREFKGLDPLRGSNPISPKDFGEKDVAKNEELVRVYRSYQEKLKEKSRYDFEDMINLVVTEFKKDEDFLRTYQERFQYILLDEFQDTNTPQNEVARLLASYWGEEANIFAVGDDQQSIYRFQGASLENILFFKNLYPKAQIISLKENYRSRQEILDAAFELIEANTVKISSFIKGVERRLISAVSNKSDPQKDSLKRLQVGHFSSGITEAYFVATKIKELIKSGTKPSAVAVLYRHNSDASEFADTLSRLNIRFDLRAGVNVLADHDLEKLLRLLEVILKLRSKDEDLDLFTLFNYEFLQRRFGFDYLDTLKLARLASDKKVNFLEAITHPDFEKKSGLGNPRSYKNFIDQLVYWQKEEANQTFVSFFETVVNESGFLDWLLNLPDSVDKLNCLNSLFAEVKRLNGSDHRLNLSKFFEDLGILRHSNIAITEKDLDIKTEAVVLTTAHGAKGLEFDYVFIVKCLDGKFGNNKVRELIKLPSNLLSAVEDDLIGSDPLRGSDPIDPNEDERRLFYVALTRARSGVFVTYADGYPSESYSREYVPSQFLSEIGEDKKGQIEVGHYEKEVQKILKEVLGVVSRDRESVSQADFLKTVLIDFRLSVTSLNTYLQCPYKFKINTLFRTPRAKDKSLSFGSAVHKALEKLLRKYREENRLPGYQYLLDQFEVALRQEILSHGDEIDSLRKGQKMLKAYYDFYKSSLARPLYTEKFFGYGFSPIYLDDIPLTGKVDRIDSLEERASGERPGVRVVDYKTGRPRSRNEIEGKTQEADLSYKRQLIFYKLLSDLDRSFNYEVVEAELDFVEGREGKFIKHSFTISRQEVDDLKTTIREVMKRIRNLEFPRTTNYDLCGHCEFAMHCWSNGVPLKKAGAVGANFQSGKVV